MHPAVGRFGEILPLLQSSFRFCQSVLRLPCNFGELLRPLIELVFSEGACGVGLQ